MTQLLNMSSKLAAITFVGFNHFSSSCMGCDTWIRQTVIAALAMSISQIFFTYNYPLCGGTLCIAFKHCKSWLLPCWFMQFLCNWMQNSLTAVMAMTLLISLMAINPLDLKLAKPARILRLQVSQTRSKIFLFQRHFLEDTFETWRINMLAMHCGISGYHCYSTF